MIGHNIGQNIQFRDQFTQSLSEEKREYEKQVGKTEWVLIKTNLMKWIQEGFRRNWDTLRSGLADRSLTGGQFQEKIRSFCLRYKQNQQQGLPQVTVPCEVKIQFPPTNFTFSVSF